MKNNTPSTLLIIGFYLIPLSLLLRASQINLPFFLTLLWFFFGTHVLYAIIGKITIMKNGLTTAKITTVLYLLGFIIVLYWYNPHHITAGPALCIVGFAINYAVMAANGGRMPVRCPQEWIIDTHLYVAMKNADPDKTKMNILGDWIHASTDIGKSPGDCIIEIGPWFTAVEIFLFF